MERCQFTCSDNTCPGPAGNENCQDESLDCPRDEFLVKNLTTIYYFGNVFWKNQSTVHWLIFRDTAIQAQMNSTQQSRIASILVVQESALENLGMNSVKMKSGPAHIGNMRLQKSLLCIKRGLYIFYIHTLGSLWSKSWKVFSHDGWLSIYLLRWWMSWSCRKWCLWRHHIGLPKIPASSKKLMKRPSMSKAISMISFRGTATQVMTCLLTWWKNVNTLAQMVNAQALQGMMPVKTPHWIVQEMNIW